MYETEPNLGHLISKRVVDANDPVYQRLSILLNEHHAGWQRGIFYGPSPYVFRSDIFTIRIYADKMTADFYSPGEWRSSMKKDIPELLQLLGLPERNDENTKRSPEQPDL